MNLLAIETSGPILSIAIKKIGRRTRMAAIRGPREHAEKILPLIDRLLKKERLKISDIGAFLISRGPGSFTGLRVGFAALKGFLAVHSRPCYGALSLDLIAARIKGNRPFFEQKTGAVPSSDLTVCRDARRGKLYARSYRYQNNRWVPRGPARVLLPEKMVPELSGETWVAGDGIAKLAAKSLRTVPEKYWGPQAADLIALFEARDPMIKKLGRPKEFLPVYFRDSEPEEKLKGK